jgi:hypothetical protein
VATKSDTSGLGLNVKIQPDKKKQGKEPKKIEPTEDGESNGEGPGAQGLIDVGDAVKAVLQLIKDFLPTAMVRVQGCDCQNKADKCWVVLGPQNNDDKESLPYDIKIGNTGDGVEIDFGNDKPQPLAQGISGPFKGKLPPGKAIRVRFCGKAGSNAVVAHWPGTPPPAPKGD